MDLKTEILLIAKSLEIACMDYAYCGAIALAIHGYPRATKDIDLLIPSEALDGVRRELGKLTYDLDAGFIPFDTGTPNARKIFRTSKAEGSNLITIDLLLVSEIYQEIWDDREWFELDGQKLKVVSCKGLIAMKRLAGRPQDIADIAALEGMGNG
jgi:predicted nucleotidyltransferase